MSQVLLDVQRLRKHFPGRRSLLEGRSPAIEAVDDVSFSIAAGETLGLVGESGSGKSTLGRTLLQLELPTAGRVLFDGEDITGRPEPQLRVLRRRAQMIFQDPIGSLDPRMLVGDIIAEPLDIHGLAPSRAQRRQRVEELLDLVRLPAAAAFLPGRLARDRGRFLVVQSPASRAPWPGATAYTAARWGLRGHRLRASRRREPEASTSDSTSSMRSNRGPSPGTP